MKGLNVFLIVITFPLLIGALMLEYVLPGKELEMLNGIAMEIKDVDSNDINKIFKLYKDILVLLWKQLLIVTGFIILWIKLCPF